MFTLEFYTVSVSGSCADLTIQACASWFGYTVSARAPDKMDGWMTCNFMSFLTVLQSYQDDVWMIMKGCVQWNSVYG